MKKKKTKIVIMVTAWKRPEILLKCVSNLRRQMEEFDIMPLFVLSPEDYYYAVNKEIIKGLYYIDFPNLPLSDKHNAGVLAAANEIEFDYLMNLGSDDTITDELLRQYRNIMDSSPDTMLFGVNSVYINDTKTGDLYTFTIPKTAVINLIGAGRMIHRKALAKLDNILYDSGLESGLDTNSELRLKEKGINATVLNFDKPQVTDFKSSTNINHMMILKQALKKVEND